MACIDAMPARLRGAEPSLAGHQRVAGIAALDDDGMQKTVDLDGLGE